MELDLLNPGMVMRLMDIVGVIFFSVLVIYFWRKKKRTLLEDILMYVSAAGIVIDGIGTLEYFDVLEPKRKKKSLPDEEFVRSVQKALASKSSFDLDASAVQANSSGLAAKRPVPADEV